MFYHNTILLLVEYTIFRKFLIMGIKYELIKFTNFADDIIKGRIYMNPLEYFRGIEQILNGNIKNDRNSAINDFVEGSIGNIHKNDLGKIGIDFSNEIKDALIGGVQLLSEDLKYLKIFSLYIFLFDDNSKIAVKPNKKIFEFAANKAVIIKNTEEFKNRFISALEINKEEKGLFSCAAQPIEYYDSRSEFGKLGPFNKDINYCWQHEFRIIVEEKTPNLNPLIIDIGDISDIAICVDTKSLIETPELLYPEYKFIVE